VIHVSVVIREVGPDELPRYATIPMCLTVNSVFRVQGIAAGLGGLALVEEPVDHPYGKCYDSGELEDSQVLDWSRQFDVSHSGFFVALDGDRPIGGAAVAIDTPAVHMLENRPDLAVLWDIRVHPDWWRRGIGSRLFRMAADWARGHDCVQLKIETQNINVPACRFYRSQGCELGGIHRFFYAGIPLVAHEVALFWYLQL